MLHFLKTTKAANFELFILKFRNEYISASELCTEF